MVDQREFDPSTCCSSKDGRRVPPCGCITGMATRARPVTSSTPTMHLSMMIILILALMRSVTANCECGYQLTINNASTPSTFTDLIESDFLHLTNISMDTDWRRQEFQVTAAAGRGPYGMNFTVQNVISNPILNASNWTGPSEFGGDPGLQFIVDGGIPANSYVQVAEMNSAREDLLWGSYRTAMKLSLVPGTCSAFFWVRSSP